MTPGTQPTMVNMVTINIDPQPLSITAKGGNMTHSKTRQQLIRNLQFIFHETGFNHIRLKPIISIVVLLIIRNPGKIVAIHIVG